MEARIKAKKKMRKILLIGIFFSVYGIMVNYLVDDLELLLKAGFMVIIINATALFTLYNIRKKCKKREEQEQKNEIF